MLIEVIGPSGAGKTRITAQIIRRLMKKSADVFALHPDYFPFKWRPLGRPRNKSLQNLTLDLLALKTILGSHKINKQLRHFAVNIIRQRADSPLTALNLIRSVWRKVGVNQYLRGTQFDNQVVIVDEGLTHAIHNLFVHLKSQHRSEDLRDFSNLLPLPDLIIYIRSPMQILIKRSQNRCDLSRRARGGNVELFLERADKVFEEFTNLENIKEKTLVFENAEDGIKSIDLIAGKATDHICTIWKGGNA